MSEGGGALCNGLSVNCYSLLCSPGCERAREISYVLTSGATVNTRISKKDTINRSSNQLHNQPNSQTNKQASKQKRTNKQCTDPPTDQPTNQPTSNPTPPPQNRGGRTRPRERCPSCFRIATANKSNQSTIDDSAVRSFRGSGIGILFVRLLSKVRRCNEAANFLGRFWLGKHPAPSNSLAFAGK